MFAFLVVGVFVAIVFAIEMIKVWRRETEFRRRRDRPAGRSARRERWARWIGDAPAGGPSDETVWSDELQRELVALRREVLELRQHVGDAHFGMTRRA